jgi:hypothetical protein
MIPEYCRLLSVRGRRTVLPVTTTGPMAERHADTNQKFTVDPIAWFDFDATIESTTVLSIVARLSPTVHKNGPVSPPIGSYDG